jgi:heme exporter protein C
LAAIFLKNKTNRLRVFSGVGACPPWRALAPTLPGQAEWALAPEELRRSAADRQRGSAALSGILTLASAAFVGIALIAAFYWAPTEKTMGILQKIFYFHAASGWAGMAALTIAFVANISFLLTRKIQLDWLALAGVEVGLAFFTIVLITGPIWAKPAWGIWWTWDARLTSTFILWILDICYLLLRQLVENPERRAVVSAVYGIFAYLDVPLVYFSIWWWRTQHPSPMIGRPGGLAPGMGMAFFLSFVATTCVMSLFIFQRYKLESLRHQIAEMQLEADVAA